MKHILSTIILTLTCLAASTHSMAMSQSTFASSPTNVRFNPLGAAFGMASGGIDVGLSSKVSLGLDASYMKDAKKFVGDKGSLWGVEARATHYASGMSEDSLISTITLEKSGVEYADADPRFNIDALGARCLVGYRWVHDSGLNTSLSGGLGKYAAKLRCEKTHDIKDAVPALEMTVGWQI